MAEKPILFNGERDRFLAFVLPEPNSGCWLWDGAVNDKGYGRFGRGEMAHRASLRLAGRRVPNGKEVDHLCRVRGCVNPDHLEAVTHVENIRRKPPAPTTCPHGHPIVVANGRRLCRACERARSAASYRRRMPEKIRNGRAWLTADERRGIKTMIQEGVSHSKISLVFNVSVATVSRVRNSNA